MSGAERRAVADGTTTATAELRTSHGSADAAERVAAAVAPDNTAEMTTHVEGETVVTTIERDAANGLQSTVDDYVVNLRVAAQLTNEPIQSNHE